MTKPDGREADIDIFNEPLTAHEDQNAAGTEAMRTEGDGGVLNDHQLLAAYVEGDEKGFETLVEKYFQMVYTLAERRTGDSHLAEEIAQSVFLILCRKARGFSSRSSVPGWLIRTTLFVCRDAIKMRHRRSRNEQRLARTFGPQLEINPEPSAMELLLQEAIQSLRPHEQAGIVARFFEGRNFREIAQMFAITERTARKRTSRSLAKLQNFMAKRGVRTALPALFGLLVARTVDAATHQALKSAILATHAAWKGKVVAENAAVLAHRTLRVLRWRRLAGSSLKVALPVLLIFAGVWSVREWSRPVSGRLEMLGKAWGAFDQLVARHRQFMMQTPPDTPNYQRIVQQELGAISQESSRIISELNPLLAPPNERTRLAEFLTAELDETLKLDTSTKTRLFAYIQNRLAQGATFNDGMKALAQTTQVEAREIKAMLSSGQQQLFDTTYGPDGVLLFSYVKVVALGQIGP